MWSAPAPDSSSSPLPVSRVRFKYGLPAALPGMAQVNLFKRRRLTQICLVVGDAAALLANVLRLIHQRLDLLDIKVARTACKGAQLILAARM